MRVPNRASGVAALLLGVCAYGQTSASTGPMRIFGGVIAANKLSGPNPVVPEEARRQHISGAVVLHVIIGEDGHVLSATPISGPELLRQPYADTVMKWTYRPYMLNGKAIAVDTTITLSVQLNGDSQP